MASQKGLSQKMYWGHFFDNPVVPQENLKSGFEPSTIQDVQMELYLVESKMAIP